MRTPLLAAILLASACQPYNLAPSPVRRPATPTDHGFTSPPSADVVPFLAFHSDFWVNLHHFLNALARARLATLDSRQPLMLAAVADAPMIPFATDAARADWDEAIAIYADAIAKWSISSDSALVDLDYHLASLASSPVQTIAYDPQIPPIIRRALVLAEPAYGARWWPAHDAANRAWMLSARAMINGSSPAIQPNIERALGQPWNPERRTVEVVRYANASGMYAAERPMMITVSSAYASAHQDDAIERVYSAAASSETDLLVAALRDAGMNPTSPQVRELLDNIVRYSVGDAIVRAIPSHAFLFGTITEHNRYLIEKYWVPHLQGRVRCGRRRWGSRGSSNEDGELQLNTCPVLSGTAYNFSSPTGFDLS
ncbi:MAG: hypothetical protein M3Z17_04930 [Gemmatimonadota bacterium]|nr:hypothetical protein [Gemmatimonadota bacterium]